jgi:hypothetical protein
VTAGFIDAPRRASAFTLVGALFLLFFLVEQVVPALKYLKYTLPLIAVGTTFVDGRPTPALLEVPRRILSIALVLVVASIGVSLLAALFHEELLGRFFAETYFLLAPLGAAYFVVPSLEIDRTRSYVQLAFWTVVVGYVLERKMAIVDMALHLSLIVYQLLKTDIVSAESGSSFVFGLFCLYFLVIGERKWSIASFIFVCLSFKRIAILGVVVVAVVQGLMRVLRVDPTKHRTFFPILLVALNALVFAAIYEISRGTYDAAILDATGLPPNVLMQGRANVYDYILHESGVTWFGHGLGHATVILASSGFGIANAHSDILKYVVEVGPLVSCVLMFGFYRLCSGSRGLFTLMLYLNVLFITDNVSIYFDVMFVFFMLGTFLIVRDRQVCDASNGSPSAARP